MLINWENPRQVALWTHELSGQVSDGHWENSVPYNHWEKPCTADVVIDPSLPLGPSWKHSRGYNFADKELVGLLAERMITYVKFALAFPQWVDYVQYFDGFLGCKNSEQLKVSGRSALRWAHCKEEIQTILDSDLTTYDTIQYDEADLKRDLNRMTKIWRESRK